MYDAERARELHVSRAGRKPDLPLFNRDNQHNQPDFPEAARIVGDSYFLRCMQNI